MWILGTVKDASKELPIEGARVGLFLKENDIKEKELAQLFSDKDGRFEHKEAARYIGESLVCEVEKEGFKSQEITYKIEHEKFQLDIELVPLEAEVKVEAKEKNNLTICVKDKGNNLLEGVKITLEAEGKQVGVGFSDNQGLFKISLSYDLKDKEIRYKAELGDFKIASGQIRVEKETSIEVTMEKLPISYEPKSNRWIKIAGIVVVLTIAAIVACFFIFRAPNLPQIISFEASQPIIKKGEQSALSWETSDAVEVKILPDIGSVEKSGTIRVSPEQRTTYILVAKNGKGRTVEKSVQIQVSIMPPPKISHFEASQPIIKKGEQSALSWETSDAAEVKILPGVGAVDKSGTIRVSPEQTTTYTLIAKNEEGKTVEKSAQIQVSIIQPPKISHFEASQPIIKKGEQSALRWETSDAVEVKILPGVGAVDKSGSIRVSLEQTTTYTLIAKNEEGKTVEKSVQIQVSIIQPPKISSFKPSQSRIKKGEQSTLRWETSDAVEVKILPGVGSVEKSGSKRVSPEQTTTYTLVAKNEEGKTVEREVRVQVEIPLPRIDDFRANQSNIEKGSESVLSWETSDAVEVKIQPDVGSVDKSGSITVSPEQTTTYTLVAKNEEGKTVEREVQVQVEIPLPRIDDFRASQSNIEKGSESTLSWETSNAVEVKIHPGVGSVDKSGSIRVSPEQTTTYRLIAKNEEGVTEEDEETIQVSIPPPKINLFQASQTNIEKGSESTLSWQTSDAVEIKILPDVGSVDKSGSIEVSPEQTTTYRLIAKNEEGMTEEDEETIKVTYSHYQIQSIDRYHHIKNRVSELCLGVRGVDSHGPSTGVEVYHCNPGGRDRGLDNQWDINQLRNGYYHIKNRISGLCLGVRGVDNHRASAGVEVYHCNPGGGDRGWDNQWSINKLSNRYYHIKNRVSGLCLGVRGVDSHGPSTGVEVYHCNPGGRDEGRDNQWIIENKL